MPDKRQNRKLFASQLYVSSAMYKKKTTEIVEKIVHLSSPHATDY